MNIAILIPTIKPGGAEKQAALLAISLSNVHQVFFITFSGHKEESQVVRQMLEEAGISIRFLEGSIYHKSKEYYKFLKNNDIEICFNYLSQCDIIGSIIEKCVGVKRVFNGIRNSRLAFLKLIGEWFAHNFVADYTIYNCYSGARYFESKGYSKKKTLVIPNCFPNIAEPIVRNDCDVKKIITVARFQPQKDYETVVRCIAEIYHHRRDFEFYIVGHGYLEEKIRQWVKEYGIENCTSFFIAPDNVPELLKNADIYLSTSLFEGTSNSIMEAMNFSLPVVATDVGDNNQLIQDGSNGFLSSIGDYKALATNIKKLLDDKKLRVEMGIKGNERLQQYSVEKFIDNYSKLMEI